MDDGYRQFGYVLQDKFGNPVRLYESMDSASQAKRIFDEWAGQCPPYRIAEAYYKVEK